MPIINTPKIAIHKMNDTVTTKYLLTGYALYVNEDPYTFYISKGDDTFIHKLTELLDLQFKTTFEQRQKLRNETILKMATKIATGVAASYDASSLTGSVADSVALESLEIAEKLLVHWENKTKYNGTSETIQG